MDLISRARMQSTRAREFILGAPHLFQGAGVRLARACPDLQRPWPTGWGEKRTPMHSGWIARRSRWWSPSTPPEPGYDEPSKPDGVEANPIQGHAGFPCCMPRFDAVGLASFGWAFVGLFPLRVLEPQRLCVLRHGPFGLVLCAAGEGSVDFQADRDLGVRVFGQEGDDLVRDLDHAHLRGGGIDADVSMKSPSLRGCWGIGRCRGTGWRCWQGAR